MNRFLSWLMFWKKKKDINIVKNPGSFKQYMEDNNIQFVNAYGAGGGSKLHKPINPYRNAGRPIITNVQQVIEVNNGPSLTDMIILEELISEGRKPFNFVGDSSVGDSSSSSDCSSSCSDYSSSCDSSSYDSGSSDCGSSGGDF